VKSWYRLGPISIDPIASLKIILIILLAKFFPCGSGNVSGETYSSFRSLRSFARPFNFLSTGPGSSSGDSLAVGTGFDFIRH